MLQFLIKGGPIMVPLVFCSILALAIIIEKFMSLKIIESKAGKFIERALGILNSDEERKIEGQAIKTANLTNKYGKLAAIVLAGKNLTLFEAEGILKKAEGINDNLFEFIVEAERIALKRRFW